ncbi:hypothetical protein [Methylocystis sp. SB2]|uniref:hypothetical protein n=1 Tax=Methylocystis sp. (strain SB2) TaxID=743836 RepID=UPI0004A2E94F
MLRLKSEFDKYFQAYSFEIKRGEKTADGREAITNEFAGRLLMAFDLDEPHSCHQVYKVFDEKYAGIFGRQEVTAARIVFLVELFNIISDKIIELRNEHMAGYALTRFFILNVILHIIDKFPDARRIISNKDEMASEANRALPLSQVPDVIHDIIIDFNYEIEEDGTTLDYKSDLKSPARVLAWRNRLLSSYEKDLKKGKATKFGR